MKFTEHEQWDSALYYAKDLQLLAVKEKGEISNGNACCYYLIAEIYMSTHQSYPAYQFYKKAVVVFSKMKRIYSTDMYCLALGRAGFMCMELGLMDEAQSYFADALLAYKLVKDVRGNLGDNIQVRMMLAVLAAQKGDYIKAENLYINIEQALDTMPRSGYNYYLLGAVKGDHAILYYNINYPLKAIESLQTSLQNEKLALQNGAVIAREDYIRILLNLAEGYTLTGDIKSAKEKCKEAEDSLYVSDNVLYASLLKEKAYICQQQKQWQQAIALNRQYRKITDDLPQKMEDYDATVVNMGTVYRQAKEYVTADTMLRTEIKRLHTIGYNYSYVMQQAVIELCANLIQVKKYNEATDSLLMICGLTYDNMRHNFLGMSETEKMQYEKGLDKIFDLLYVCLYKNSFVKQHTLAAVYNAELQRKGLALNSQSALLNRLRSSKDTALLNLVSKWTTNKELLSRQYSLPYSERFLHIDSLEEVCEKTEKQISAKAVLFSSKSDSATAKTKDKKIKNNYADIAFLRFNYKATIPDADSTLYAAFIVTSADSVPRFVHLCSSYALMKLMKDAHGAWISETQLTAKLYGNNSADGNRLYQLLWKPLAPHLTGVKTINYSPAGKLNNIAFQAIHDGKNYLADEYTFHRFFNLKDAAGKPEIYEAPEAISIWGNMNYNKAVYAGNPAPATTNHTLALTQESTKPVAFFKNVSSQPLYSFSTNEPLQLKKIFGSRHIKVSSCESSQASEEYFKQQAAGTRGVLHISTHGFYTPFNDGNKKAILPGNYISGIENPLFRCGLAFAGVNSYWVKGKVKDNCDDGILTGFEAAQLDLHQVQLVTLSACETGLGDITDNEGNLGLQRAFKLAGARRLLVSLWQVPAKQTAELLAAFYTNWLRGQALAVALGNAERTMSKNYPPYYWAGFVLIE